MKKLTAFLCAVLLLATFSCNAFGEQYAQLPDLPKASEAPETDEDSQSMAEQLAGSWTCDYYGRMGVPLNLLFIFNKGGNVHIVRSRYGEKEYETDGTFTVNTTRELLMIDIAVNGGGTETAYYQYSLNGDTLTLINTTSQAVLEFRKLTATTPDLPEGYHRA